MADPLVILNFVKVFAPTVVAFIVGILITPLVTHYLYKHKLWKKRAKTVSTDGRDAPIFRKLHAHKEIGTPRMGGIVVWGSTLITILGFWFVSQIDGVLAEKMNFLSRNQTWLPLFTLIVGALIGLFDDWLETRDAFDNIAGGLSYKKRLLVVLAVSIVGSWWFFSKLEVTSIIVPFAGVFDIGWWFIPFFIFVMLAVYSGGVIDGIDGLSGGAFAAAFSAYGVIAFFQDQFDIAAFSLVLVGSILAFLWFNIPPARFYLSETGSMALTLTLGVIAFLTQQVILLPIIAFPLAVSSLSSSLQLFSKKFFGRKIFLVAPIHHHFEAIGWPGYKVTMRYWIISIIVAILGTLAALLG